VAFGLATSATAEPGPVASKQAEAQSIISQISSLETQVSAAIERWNLANVKLTRIGENLQRSRFELGVAKVNLKHAQVALARQALDVYTSSDANSTVEVLLGASSLDDLLNRLRSRAGTDVIYKHAAAREILRLLKNGALVAIPIDQHQPGAAGVPIPFFGRPAATTPGPARLAQLTRVPVQVAVLVRRGETNQHDILVRPPLAPPAPARIRPCSSKRWRRSIGNSSRWCARSRSSGFGSTAGGGSTAVRIRGSTWGVRFL